MSVALYMDEHVHRAITVGLRLRVTIGVCVRDLELIARAAGPQDLANRVEFLPL